MKEPQDLRGGGHEEKNHDEFKNNKRLRLF
jgi:hypothetical protein